MLRKHTQRTKTKHTQLPQSARFPDKRQISRHSLLLYHLGQRVLETLGLDGVLVQAVEQIQAVGDSLVGVILIQRLLRLVDFSHVLQESSSEKDKTKRNISM